MQANKLPTDTNQTHKRTNIMGNPCFQTPKVPSLTQTAGALLHWFNFKQNQHSDHPGRIFGVR